jgi:hypothetical protein
VSSKTCRGSGGASSPRRSPDTSSWGADLPVESEAEIRNLLERLGDPADIAAESRERFGVRRRQAGIVEILALIGLLVGGVVLPIIGWFVGLIFLWVSAAWTTREKLLALRLRCSAPVPYQPSPGSA